ncbi:xylose isomerase [Bradyrhizobium sacchari]|uniref:Sugar phosphate isomerase/epimerase n=1 Tax=Bradyrhizobium sacchari TaxID=1399419 RepID=A0A560KN60_9BRAD|nr:TIM barrel protein [Bradyrhizobium sacchari]OPY96554.1 xylose isomerase [Bradyrhizobium sacchari]TWB67335.1 sugar phosphate isomerase/epimerase [Bradyrhizobium sacchari]TWB84572.1 sugar phosphate isomerase/epimerase [Bradyrhizobium sacchari]
MTHIYSLAYLTSAPMAPPDALLLAQKLGYQAIGVRVAPATPGGDFSPLATDPCLLLETIRGIDDTGITVFDVEIARLRADFEVDQFAAFLEAAGELKARAILVAGDDLDEARLTDSFAQFCKAAASYGLTADLEFMPWTAVKNAEAALRIVTKAGEPNGRVLVDALHAARSATTLNDIAALPRNLLSYAQLCDAPARIPTTNDELIHTARCARLIPGEGGIDLAGIVSALPDDLPLSLEIPNDEWLPRLGAEEWGRRALAAARRVVAAAAGGGLSA